MNDYVTIKQAAVLANRAPRKIYEWVQNGRLPARKDEHGVLVVKGVDVLRAESTVKRGRPRGTVTRRADMLDSIRQSRHSD